MEKYIRLISKAIKSTSWIVIFPILLILVFLWGLTNRINYLEADRKLKLSESRSVELEKNLFEKDKDMVSGKEVIELVRDLTKKKSDAETIVDRVITQNFSEMEVTTIPQPWDIEIISTDSGIIGGLEIVP